MTPLTCPDCGSPRVECLSHAEAKTDPVPANCRAARAWTTKPVYWCIACGACAVLDECGGETGLRPYVKADRSRTAEHKMALLLFKVAANHFAGTSPANTKRATRC